MTTLSDLLIFILVRGFLGLFLGAFLGGGVWFMAWLYFQNTTIGTDFFLISQALIISLATGIGIVFAWWNPENPRKVQFLNILLILLISFLGAWLIVKMRGFETYYGLFGPSQRIEVISIKSIILPMFYASIIGGSVTALLIFSYRVIRHREF